MPAARQPTSSQAHRPLPFTYVSLSSPPALLPMARPASAPCHPRGPAFRPPPSASSFPLSPTLRFPLDLESCMHRPCVLLCPRPIPLHLCPAHLCIRHSHSTLVDRTCTHASPKRAPHRLTPALRAPLPCQCLAASLAWPLRHYALPPSPLSPALSLHRREMHPTPAIKEFFVQGRTPAACSF